MGIPKWLCTFYRNYLGDLKRYFTFGGFFNPTPIHSICGVPQGDALSLIWAAVGLSVWALLMERSTSVPWDRFHSTAMAYIDDRYVIAHDHKNFYRLLKDTIEHDKLAGFRLNLGKSALMASSAAARRQLRNSKFAIPLKLSFTALGHALSSAARRSFSLANKRFSKSRASLSRVRQSRITSHFHKGRAISGLCLPQASYGSWLAGVPTRAGRSLGSSFLRVLWGRGGHYRAKEIALSLLYPIHLVCPIIAADYTLLTTIARLARRHEHIKHQISRLLDFYVRTDSRGISGNFPVSRLMEVVASFGATCDSSLTICSTLHPPVSLIHAGGSALGHYLRNFFRLRAWHELRDRAINGEHADFKDLQVIDVPATMSWYRSMSDTDPTHQIIRRTIAIALTGAIATTSRLHKHQDPGSGVAPPVSPLCPYCGQEDEDLTHLLWRCEAWQDLRKDFLSGWQARWHSAFLPNTLLATHCIAFESIELLLWRRNNFVAEWQYSDAPFPQWDGDGDAIHEDACLVVYTDGACQHQGDPRICSAGCGIFVCPGHPWNTSFVLPGATYSSEQAELRALLHAIEGATEQNIDIIVKLDNQYVVDTAVAVLAGSCCWPASGHDLWRRLSLAQSKQIKAGLSGHQVTWIKGHATHLDVELDIITSADRFGNFNADRLASAAASRSCCPRELVALSKVRGLQTREVQKYIVEVLLNRHVLLLEKSAANAPFVVRSRHLPGAVISANLASIREAFLALHCF